MVQVIIILISGLLDPFTNHPRIHKKNYITHLFFALGIAILLLIALICCIIHAFLPFLFINTTRKIVQILNKKLFT